MAILDRAGTQLGFTARPAHLSWDEHVSTAIRKSVDAGVNEQTLAGEDLTNAILARLICHIDPIAITMEKLPDNRPIALTYFKISPSPDVARLNPLFRDDPAIAAAAFAASASNLSLISWNVANYRNIALSAVVANPYLISDIDVNNPHYADIAKRAVFKHPLVITKLSAELRSDPAFLKPIARALKRRFLTSSLPSYARSCLRPLWSADIDLTLHFTQKHGEFDSLRDAPAYVREDRSFCHALVKRDGRYFQHINSPLMHDRELALDAIRSYPQMAAHFPLSLLRDGAFRSLVLEANPLAHQYLRQPLPWE